MNFTNLEIVLLTTCFAVSIAALIVIFNSQRSQLSLKDHELLKAIVRAEIDAHITHGEQQKLHDAMTEMVLPELRDLK